MKQTDPLAVAAISVSSLKWLCMRCICDSGRAIFAAAMLERGAAGIDDVVK